MAARKNSKWFLEVLGPDEGHLHGVKTVLLSKDTAFQHIEVIEFGDYGRSLVLDGKVQSTERDEFIYHEALVHPALLTHPNPERRSEEHTSELQSRENLVCRLLLE